jgi:hypothetical protein
MGSEPDWSKQIQSSTVCSWFYFFAIANAVLAVGGVLGMLGYAFGVKNPNFLILSTIAFPTLIASVQFWFFYLMCSRSLNV